VSSSESTILSLSGTVSTIIYRRQREAQMMDLTGVGHYHEDYYDCDDEECLGLDPLVYLEKVLAGQLEEVRAFKNHTHEWYENGRCWCGWDGNA
jgi:hypothetical protein